MQSHQIEEWVLRVIDAVKNGHRVEDCRVELKRAWIEPKKAAARLAAHANAMGGDSILWVFGVDEHGLTGIDGDDLAEWWPQVTKCFDGIPPAIRDIRMMVDQFPIVAMVIETERLPFVIKSSEGGVPERWVPWREGTRTRSATRDELVRLLSPLAVMPEFEVLSVKLTSRFPKTGAEEKESEQEQKLDLHGRIYVTPLNRDRLVFPFHKVSATIRDSDRRHIFTFPTVDLTLPVTASIAAHGFGEMSATLHASSSELVVEGPGLFETRARVGISGNLPDKKLIIEIGISPSRFTRRVLLMAEINPKTDSDGNRVWTFSA